ncbi:MAG: hypothetical protein ACXVFQ_20595 [Solirubrobacteraceae bacterium]
MTSFSLPWYAIAGAQKGVSVGLPIAGVLALAVIGPTAGRWYVDVSSGVPPKHFVRGEWFMVTALITGVVWIISDALGASTWLAAGIAFAFGYTFRVIALYRAWEEPLAKEPKGVYLHDDGRPMLGRKIKGKSQRDSGHSDWSSNTTTSRSTPSSESLTGTTSEVIALSPRRQRRTGTTLRVHVRWMTLRAHDGETEITGPIIDPSHLQGLHDESPDSDSRCTASPRSKPPNAGSGAQTHPQPAGVNESDAGTTSKGP